MNKRLHAWVYLFIAHVFNVFHSLVWFKKRIRLYTPLMLKYGISMKPGCHIYITLTLRFTISKTKTWVIQYMQFHFTRAFNITNGFRKLNLFWRTIMHGILYIPAEMSSVNILYPYFVVSIWWPLTIKHVFNYLWYSTKVKKEIVVASVLLSIYVQNFSNVHSDW